MLINENYYIQILTHLIDNRIIPFMEENIDTVMKLGCFTGYYKEEERNDGTYIRPIFNLTQLGYLFIAVMINELEKQEIKNKLRIGKEFHFSYSTFFPWVNNYMKDRFVLCYIYPKDQAQYVFYMRFQLDFVKITSLLAQYLF